MESSEPKDDDPEQCLWQELYMKGDDIQKLSVIQSLPELLKTDHNATISRLIPKIQQELPNSSSEFHIVASKIFKLLIEMNLSLNLIRPVLQGIESKDPIICSAWIETLYAIIKTLNETTVKNEVLPYTIKMAQINRLVYLRVGSCQILGQIAIHPKLSPFDVKKDILPLVQSLTQDCLHEVRAAMCSQLPNIAKGLASENIVTSSLLPCLVELSNDENPTVRATAINSTVLLIPAMKEETVSTILIPLVKKLCTDSSKEGDNTYPAIAKVYGSLLTNFQKNLSLHDSVWFLDFYKDLSLRGFGMNRAVHLDTDPGNAVACRDACAFNLPAVTYFVITQIPVELGNWYDIFKELAGDPCYLVRKTVAGCIHEITRVLGPENKIIVQDIVKLLRDDSEEVLDSLVPNIGITLDLLAASGVLSRNINSQATLDIGRALLKCQVEVFKSHNWRRKGMFLAQLEHLPMCLNSDFIHQHFTPVVLKLTEEARARPVRTQAAKTVLVFLRYSIKENHRKWIRDSLISRLCQSKSCYTRHIFINMCIDAIQMFSWKYFKENFYIHLLSLGDDPVSTVRLSAVKLLPTLKQMLLLPIDRNLQLKLEQFVSKIEVMEKDRDVIDTLKVKLKEMRTPPTNKQDALMEEKRRIEEEEKILIGKMGMPILSLTMAKPEVAAAGVGGEVRRNNLIAVTRSNSFQKRPATGTSFLDQHFYTDAGIAFPPQNEEDVVTLNTLSKIDHDIAQLALSDLSEEVVATVSVENTNIENMSDDDLKELETSTTNITDDVKVNIQKIGYGKTKIPMDSVRKRNKRYSCVFSSEISNLNKDPIKRRSLNMGAADGSKIPVGCKINRKAEERVNLQRYSSGIVQPIPKRNIFVSQTKSTRDGNSSFKGHDPTISNNNSFKERKLNPKTDVKENVPIIENTKSNVPNKSNNNKISGLPILIRKAIQK